MNRTEMLAIVRGEDRSTKAGALRAAMSLAEPFYQLAVRVRNAGYDARWLDVARLTRPVVSVGNLTAGGTGKTPTVIALARLLRELGHRPAVLLRGYAACSGLSDEATELCEALGKDVAVVANPDRVAGSGLALRMEPQTTIFLLDDGFQHRRVRRDLDLVLVDASDPFGGGRLLPRGLLREPIASLRRAHAVIVTHSDALDPAALKRLDERITREHGKPPLAHTAHRWTGFQRGDESLPIDALRDTDVGVVTGLGNPAGFEAMATAHARSVVRCLRLDDHFAYTPDNLRGFLRGLQDAGARVFLTSEKDFVKWRPLLRHDVAELPIVRPRLTLEFLDGGEALRIQLQRAAPVADAR